MIEELYEKLLAVVASGDEAAADAFLAEHLTEFPEDLQQKIMFAYFKESVEQEAGQLETIADAKKEGLELLKELEHIKKGYEEARKIQELKDSLTKTTE